MSAKVDYTNLATMREFVKALVKKNKIRTQDDLYGENGVVKEFQKELYEAMLEGELDHHLGYKKHSNIIDNNYRNGHSEKTIKTQHGEVKLAIPRDRNSSFEPIAVSKHQRRANVIDEAVIGLYAKGMSLSQISEQIHGIYQVELSLEQLSTITDSVMEKVTAWQNRVLDAIYPIIYLDGLYINVLENKVIIKKVVYIALGINTAGHKELLGLWIADSEGAKFWLNVLTEIHNRGIKSVCMFCVDGLTGFPDAINSIYPKARIQLCIVHAVRSSLRYVSYKDKKSFATALKSVYTANSKESALLALDTLKTTWYDKYPASIKSWYDRWDNLSTFFEYPEEIRKAIYTTNAIESVNASIRKIIKNKKSFPNDNSVFKVLYLALSDCSRKWNMPIHHWGQALNQFIIKFDLDLSMVTMR